MINVHDKAHELAKAIKTSSEFIEFKKAKELLNSNPKNKEMVDDFRKKQLDAQREQLMGKELSQDRLKILGDLYSTLIANSDIASYFQAEGNFLRIIEDVNKIIEDALKIIQE